MVTDFMIDEKKTKKENYEEFLKQQRAESYTLGDFTGTKQGDMEQYTELKIQTEQEEEKRKILMEQQALELKALEDKFHEDEKAIHAKYE